MANIRDININDVKLFLNKNNINVSEDKIYDRAFKLMKQKSTNYQDVPISIDEWILAHNAFKENIVNKVYTMNDIDNLSILERNELAKKLGMQGNNTDNIINILRYLHKFNNEQYNETLTGNYDIDRVFLQNFDYKILNNLDINNYTRKILDDQSFWKERLRKRLGLTTNKNIDYKFVTKFLDDGKSFEENYQEALKQRLKLKYSQVIDILVDNNVVLVNKPQGLLEDIFITIDELGEIKHLPYDQFIKSILDRTNMIITEEGENEDAIPMDISYFDEKVYTGDAIIVEIPNVLFDQYGDDIKDMITHVFRNKNGFTNGELLYEIAKKIPNNDDIKIHNIMIIKQHPDEILNEIKAGFQDIDEKYKKYGEAVVKDRIYLRKYYNIIIISELLKEPAKFLEYNEKHPNFYIGDYNSTVSWGSHVYWEGLSYYKDKYQINLGS